MDGLTPGTIFLHAKWLGEDNAPLRCRVTKVALGAVYWVSDDGSKKPYYFDLKDASKWVKEVLS